VGIIFIFLRFIQIRIFQYGLFRSVKHSGREKGSTQIYRTIYKYLSEGERIHGGEAGKPSLITQGYFVLRLLKLEFGH